jgi:hypothetical protein
MPYNDFASIKHQENLCFRVVNIAPSRKITNVFKYPLRFGQEVDLMQQFGFSEDNIKISLLKGELRWLLLTGHIYVTCSNINLLTFSQGEIDFLHWAGIDVGVEVSGEAATHYMRYNIEMSGDKNRSNRVFKTPEEFLNGEYSGNRFNICVYQNGALKLQNLDYVVEKSSIMMNDPVVFDQIRFISGAPNERTTVYATYAVKK